MQSNDILLYNFNVNIRYMFQISGKKNRKEERNEKEQKRVEKEKDSSNCYHTVDRYAKARRTIAEKTYELKLKMNND